MHIHLIIITIWEFNKQGKKLCPTPGSMAIICSRMNVLLNNTNSHLLKNNCLLKI